MGGLFFKELANEDLKTEQELLPGVLSLGCGQNNLELGSFPQHTKKVINGQVPELGLYQKLKAWGIKRSKRIL